MSLTPEGTSPVLLQNLKHNKILHEKVVLLSILPTDVPTVAARERVKVEGLGQGFYRVIAKRLYATTKCARIMKLASDSDFRLMKQRRPTTWGECHCLLWGDSKMMRWRKVLFAFMSRNAGSPAAYFGFTANRVVELGAQIQL